MINIYVGNLPYNTSESDLEDLFGQYGPVVKTAIIMDRETGRSRGFGFVEMDDPEIGRKAIEALHGAEFNGRNLTVNEARPRDARKGPYPGGSSGGGGGYGGAAGGGAPAANAPASRGYSNQRYGN